MADVPTLAAFVLASFILVIVPGPSVLFVISRGVALGRRAAVLTVLGNELGMLVQAVPLQMALLGMISITIAFACDSAWGVLAGTARAWLSGSPHRLQRLGGAGGLMMIGLGARLAVTGRND